jgi:hypothetical protein
MKHQMRGATQAQQGMTLWIDNSLMAANGWTLGINFLNKLKEWVPWVLWKDALDASLG